MFAIEKYPNYTTKNQILTVYGKLPSLNDYVKANRSGKYSGNALKQKVERLISAQIYNQELKQVSHPVDLHFTWVEKTKRRDKDNVAFAKKFILDSLQKTKILPNDNNRWIDGFEDDFLYGTGHNGVIVEIKEIIN